MEIYSKTTRFALACNASDKIIGLYCRAVSTVWGGQEAGLGKRLGERLVCTVRWANMAICS